MRNIEDWEPGTHRGGRQHEAAARNPCTSMPRIVEHERVLFRSQSGPAAGTAFAVALSNPLVRVDSQFFRVLLLRRLRLPLPPTSRTCRCGRLLVLPSSCIVQAGVLGTRGFAVARVCREAGERVAHQFVGARSGPSSCGERRPSTGGGGGRAPIARWGPVGCRHDHGTARRGTADRDGVALDEARRRRGPTQNSSSRGTGPSWWFSLAKLEAGGLWKQCRSSDTYEPRRSQQC